MEPIKISIDVNLNVSESTRAFFVNLFGGNQSNKPLTRVDTTPAPTQPAASAPTLEPVKTAPSAPVAPAPSTPVSTPAHTIDELRKALASKVNVHRAAIKAKLQAYGAESLTTLAKENYNEMYDFLASL